MKKCILLGVCCTFLTVCSAQIKFRSDNYLGLSSGAWGSAGLIQTVNGLYKGPWFLGLGAGLDYYRFRSVPLFLSLTRDLPSFSKRSGLFVALNAGTNLPWYTRKLSPYDEFTSSKFYPGSWWSASLDYKWKLSVRTGKALLLSAGYSMKKLKENLTGPSSSTCITPGACEVTLQTYVYEYLNRSFFFAIGVQF
ncbi:hypothetical protein [Dinghuibacter silviterrae]|uniref:Outer membrane protein with beta-barrel domain n=1 Tax=Dinghuibacter silviterrae TaxID=1539049 RepID=A0A4R8DRM5_9BACT|nr:hypothetical protein [Dinghuibacter silviterrae]TDX00629.1 hypothetical protein EDB95_1654 [Dinghuibacter silviterrae]